MPLITAHRGGRFWEGNNFSYITDSIREGADIIELDIRIRNNQFFVQHSLWESPQGFLEEALKRLEGADIYLDIKDKNINVNTLIDFVRLRCTGRIIVGSFDLDLLRTIKDPEVQRNYHSFLPWWAISRARLAGAHWINPLPYFITKSVAQEIQVAGFKFVPSGNQIFKKNEITSNQLAYARWGAYAISTHHVKAMKLLLQGL